MKSDKLNEIRRLLNELEVSDPEGAADQAATMLDHDTEIVTEVVDYLQPLLTPYQSAFYWYLLRHSHFRNRGSLVRVSTRGLGKGVVKSSRSETVSQSQIKELMMALEAIGAIRKEAEPNRAGTLYRILLPSQIEGSQRLRASLAVAPVPIAPGEAEVDYYNVRENRRKIYERDKYVCCYCSKQLDERTATLDHVVAITCGGGNTMDNLATACLSCNSQKNHRPLGDFLAERPRR